MYTCVCFCSPSLQASARPCRRTIENALERIRKTLPTSHREHDCRIQAKKHCRALCSIAHCAYRIEVGDHEHVGDHAHVAEHEHATIPNHGTYKDIHFFIYIQVRTTKYYIYIYISRLFI